MNKCVGALKNELKKIRTAARTRPRWSTSASSTTARSAAQPGRESRGRGRAHADRHAVEKPMVVIEKAIMKPIRA
jgi:hypothetical protein